MAGSSLLMLLDDISSILDDVATMTKVAAKKTSGVLGDDLALNAQQVSGVNAERELPVVWAVAKGSMKNKLILVPSALIISALIPWLIMPLLMLGGAYLCFEGMEKLAHKFFHNKAVAQVDHESLVHALNNPNTDVLALEKEKIKGAVRTDFILSAEIIVIALGTVAAVSFLTQVAVLSGIAVLMTVGVYGLVAAIVKLDDAGLYLSRKGGVLTKIGYVLLAAAPRLMKTLTVVGTTAMFMVGGGILTHGIPFLHHLIENFAANVAVGIATGLAGIAGISVLNGIVMALLPTLFNTIFGMIAGTVVLALVKTGEHYFSKR